MAEDKPFIEPNSGRSSQPGGRATYSFTKPADELPDLSEDVKTQVQDDPEGTKAIDPDEQGAVPEELVKQLKQEREEAEQDTTERTGEAKTGTGETIVTADQADGKVAPEPGSGGEETVGSEGKPGGDNDPGKSPESQVVPTPKGEAPGEGGQTQAEKDADKREQAAKEAKAKDAVKDDDKSKGSRNRAGSQVKDV